MPVERRSKSTSVVVHERSRIVADHRSYRDAAAIRGERSALVTTNVPHAFQERMGKGRELGRDVGIAGVERDLERHVDFDQGIGRNPPQRFGPAVLAGHSGKPQLRPDHRPRSEMFVHQTTKCQVHDTNPPDGLVADHHDRGAMGMLPWLSRLGRRLGEVNRLRESLPRPSFDGTFQAVVEGLLVLLAVPGGNEPQVTELMIPALVRLEHTGHLNHGKRREIEAVFGHRGEHAGQKIAAHALHAVGRRVLQRDAGAGVRPQLGKPMAVVPKIAVDFVESLDGRKVLQRSLLQFVQRVGCETAHRHAGHFRFDRIVPHVTGDLFDNIRLD